MSMKGIRAVPSMKLQVEATHGRKDTTWERGRFLP